MKRIILMTTILSMLCLTAKAQQYAPEGATQLYYSYYQGTGYGNNLAILTVYELSGQYYLRRVKGFAGMIGPVKTKEDKMRRLPDVTMPLSEKQLDKIRQLMEDEQLATLGRACMEEEQRNIDTGYTKPSDNEFVFGTSMDKSFWEQTIEWPGVLTGVKTKGAIAFGGYSDEHHQQRNSYLEAVSKVNNELHDIIDKYVKKNIKRLWREYQAK